VVVAPALSFCCREALTCSSHLHLFSSMLTCNNSACALKSVVGHNKIGFGVDFAISMSVIYNRHILRYRSGHFPDLLAMAVNVLGQRMEAENIEHCILD
jgi:hypothetical protein